MASGGQLRPRRGVELRPGGVFAPEEQLDGFFERGVNDTVEPHLP
jgi:hypothetical protein